MGVGHKYKHGSKSVGNNKYTIEKFYSGYSLVYCAKTNKLLLKYKGNIPQTIKYINEHPEIFDNLD